MECGLRFVQKGDFDKAITYFSEAIRLDAKLAAAYYNRGMAFRESGDESKAEADLAEAKNLGFSSEPEKGDD